MEVESFSVSSDIVSITLAEEVLSSAGAIGGRPVGNPQWPVGVCVAYFQLFCIHTTHILARGPSQS